MRKGRLDLSRKKKEQLKIKCIAYLSTEGDLYGIEKRENRQLRYLNDYAKAHDIDICRVLRRNGMGQIIVNKHWEYMTAMIKKGIVDGVLIVNTEAVSASIPDAFYKVGQIHEAGGIVVTVDEGKLGMPVRRMIDGKMVLVNERF